MQPHLHVAGLTIEAYGLMLTVAAVAVLIVLERMAVERELPRRWVGEGVVVALVAGVVGARLYWLIEHGGSFSLATAIGRGSGLTWYGGVLLGAVSVLAWARWRGVPLLVAADGAAVALPLGQVFGRIGCLLAGDGDYGPPSDLPWAMGFPHGTVPTPPGVHVHPTMIYEALAALAIFAFLWPRRHRYRDGVLLWLYLVLGGSARFLAEFVRNNDAVALGLTAAQLTSAGLVVVGALALASAWRSGSVVNTARHG